MSDCIYCKKKIKDWFHPEFTGYDVVCKKCFHGDGENKKKIELRMFLEKIDDIIDEGINCSLNHLHDMLVPINPGTEKKIDFVPTEIIELILQQQKKPYQYLIKSKIKEYQKLYNLPL